MSFRFLCLRLIVSSLILSGVAGAQPVVNGKIAFTSFRDNHSQIYLMNSDGSNEVNICGTALFLSVIDISPRWSPDASQIAFVRTINPPASVYEIYSMNPDCSNVIQLTFDNARNFGPRWSPDGRRIAFYSTKGSNNFQIWVMNADGSGETRLTNDSFDDVSPSWSPDGSQIAFATNRDGRFEVYVMDADGSAQTNLTRNAAYDDYPAWSPDGLKIAFRTDRDGVDGIYVMNVDGSSPTRITNSGDITPGWSPDGTKIVFTSIQDDGIAHIYRVNADGSMPTRLTNNPAGDGEPDWGVAPGSSDTTPPIIVPEITGTLGNNGWYTSNVTVSWMVSDPESGIASSSGCATTSLTADTAGVTLQCSATNGAGLSASALRSIKIDTTAPVISGMPAAGCTLWPPNGRMVQVATVTVTDALSGLAVGSFQVVGASNELPIASDVSITPTGSGGYVVALRADRLGNGTGRTYTLTATASDLAGNVGNLTATCIVPHDQR